MDTTPLGLFATKARASNRLLYGDLRRLQRDVLPTGATSREEVEILLSLDWIERVDRDWPRYLAMTVSEFVLSTSDPPGVISGEAAAWLAAALAGTRPKTASYSARSWARRIRSMRTWWRSSGKEQSPDTKNPAQLSTERGFIFKRVPPPPRLRATLPKAP
jgi:hypothetical protein